MTEQKLRQNIVEVMKSWLGYSEENGKFKAIIDLYNTQKPLPRGYEVKYTDEWCATTVTAAGMAAGLQEIIFGECSCSRMIALYQAAGRWEESDDYIPQPGDIIMYDWQDSGAGDNTGAADHVGIVEKVVGSTITVIEGNKGEAVARRTLAVNGRYIRGYCLPDYAGKADKENETMKVYATIDEVPEAYRPAVDKLVERGVLHGYGDGRIDVSEDLCRMITILDRLGLM